MYTTYTNASEKSENVCGVHIPFILLYNPADGTLLTAEIEIDASIQLDDILPLAGMSLWPRCVFEDFERQIQFSF